MMPERIVDLHVHLFNARYIPLEGVIANAMKKNTSLLATLVARLLWRLTSSYDAHTSSFHPVESNEDDLQQIWLTAERELRIEVEKGLLFTFPQPDGENESLAGILNDLASVDYEAEGYDDGIELTNWKGSLEGEQLFSWAERILKKALVACVKLMEEYAWGKAENYLHFFRTMLKSEREMVDAIVGAYGTLDKPLQIMHLLMDMQMAYSGHKPAFYPFPAKQLHNMQRLQQEHKDRLIGFSAFDPRRDDWPEIVKESQKKGFVGFKFYCSMGYKPSGNDSAEIEKRIDDFFKDCAKGQVPIFVHCTPVGFQTIRQEGHFAHPKYWEPVLKKYPNLRLCFGHAGGESVERKEVKSAGWQAKNLEEWSHQDNYAKRVVDLCVAYPNVYCELAYLGDILTADGRKIFLNNFRLACETTVASGTGYPFLKKVAYGSDWHMPDITQHVRKYLDAFIEIFELQEFTAAKEDFFWANAYRYLKLKT